MNKVLKFAGIGCLVIVIIGILIFIAGLFLLPKDEIKNAFDKGKQKAKNEKSIDIIKKSKNENECIYHKAIINTQVGNEKLDEKIIEGCFVKSNPDDLGLVEISDQNKKIKILYYESEIPNLRFLNIRFNNSDPIEWRKNKGHDIFYVKKNGRETFIFGDRNSSVGSIKGSIRFE